MSLENSLALIFGGCCSNVFALEAIIKHEPDSGLLITVAQLLTVALFTLPTQLERRSSSPSSTTQSTKSQLTSAYTHHDPHPTSTLLRLLLPYKLRTPRIPYRRLLTASILFCLVNLLNNWAFAFDISVPMHIILRSFGSVITLVVGWWVGKRYGRVQVLGVLGLTVGVLMAAWADAGEKGADLSLGAPKKASTSSFTAGLVILFVAQFLGAVMGVYTEGTYVRHGRHWREILFYTHFFGLLFSLALLPSLLIQFRRLVLGPPISIPIAFFDFLRDLSTGKPTLAARLSQWAAAYKTTPTPQAVRVVARRLFALLTILSSTSTSTSPTNPKPAHPNQRALPSQSLLLLLLNSLTQYLCISGVNQLGAATSAVTVTVVLNIRKLASFLLSCWIFGNHVSDLMVWGAAVVFVSGAVYGLGGALGRGSAGAGVRKAAEVGKERENGEGAGVVGEVEGEEELKGKGAGLQAVSGKDSLAIAKGYATPPASPRPPSSPHLTTGPTTAPTGKSCSSTRTPWREVRDSVHGMMHPPDSNTEMDADSVAGMSELNGISAVVHTDGSMSPRGSWPRRESLQSLNQSQSPEIDRRTIRVVEAAGDGVGKAWATGMGARLNSDGSMTRR